MFLECDIFECGSTSFVRSHRCSQELLSPPPLFNLIWGPSAGSPSTNFCPTGLRASVRRQEEERDNLCRTYRTESPASSSLVLFPCSICVKRTCLFLSRFPSSSTFSHCPSPPPSLPFSSFPVPFYFLFSSVGLPLPILLRAD